MATTPLRSGFAETSSSRRVLEGVARDVSGNRITKLKVWTEPGVRSSNPSASHAHESTDENTLGGSVPRKPG